MIPTNLSGPLLGTERHKTATAQARLDALVASLKTELTQKNMWERQDRKGQFGFAERWMRFLSGERPLTVLGRQDTCLLVQNFCQGPDRPPRRWSRPVSPPVYQLAYLGDIPSDGG